MERIEEIVCYPLISEHDFSKCNLLVEELKFFFNNAQLKLISKGTDSIVIELNQRFVLKVSRLDRNVNYIREGNILLHINYCYGKERIAPKVYIFSKDFLVEEKIDGLLLFVFLKSGESEEIKKVVLKIIDKAHKLDVIGISHNELSRAQKHIIVEKKTYEPIIIDFGSATYNTNSSNLTQVASYLFLGNNAVSKLIIEKLQIEDIKLDKIKELLKIYKKGIKEKKTELMLSIRNELVQVLST